MLYCCYVISFLCAKSKLMEAIMRLLAFICKVKFHYNLWNCSFHLFSWFKQQKYCNVTYYSNWWNADLQVSEHASWSGCFYYRIIQAALLAVGAPDNLVHIITGWECSFCIFCFFRLIAHMAYLLAFFLSSFAETGQALVSSVDKIIFVGSPGVGRMVWLISEVVIFLIWCC